MKISWFDMLIYKLFFWRWNKVLRNDKGLRDCAIYLENI